MSELIPRIVAQAGRIHCCVSNVAWFVFLISPDAKDTLGSTCPTRADSCISNVVFVDIFSRFRAHVVCSSVHPLAPNVNRTRKWWS